MQTIRKERGKKEETKERNGDTRLKRRKKKVKRTISLTLYEESGAGNAQWRREQQPTGFTSLLAEQQRCNSVPPFEPATVNGWCSAN